MTRDWMKPTSLPGTPTILNGSIRYGASRNVPADGPNGETQIALVVIERENGAFETLAIPEALIQFGGKGMIENEVKRKVGLA
jgi:hypothetical protein